MPEPNPILGVHATPGAVAWARVQREADGSFRVLDWGSEHAPEESAAAAARGAAVTGRRAFRGRGSFLALPDGSGCLVTALVAADENRLDDEDLRRELHEFTPFDAGVAALRMRPSGIEGRRRRFVIAAIPSSQERRFSDAAAAHDDGTLGLGFAAPSLVRGARALGLLGASGFLVEVLPRSTHVYAVEDEDVRRYLVAQGAEDVIAAAARALGREAAAIHRAVEAGAVDAQAQAALDAAAEAIAADVRSTAEYHVAQRYAPKDPPDDLPPPEFVAAGVLLGRAPLRRAFASHLGADLLRTEPRHEPAAHVAWARPPGPALPSLAGAVGAALEAFEPAERRLALRAPPREVAPATAVGPAAWIAAIVVAAAAAAAAWYVTRPIPPSPPSPSAGRRAPRVGTPETPEGGASPAPAAAGAAEAARAPRLSAARVDDSCFELAWDSDDAGRLWNLERLDAGATEWTVVREAVEGSGRCEDCLRGASGTYRWRLVAPAGGDGSVGATVSVKHDVAVTTALVRVGPGDRATFRLGRVFRGEAVESERTVAPGEMLEAAAARPDGEAPLVLSTGLRLVSAGIREEEEPGSADVPEFGPDGRVVRGPDGQVPRTRREVPHTVRIHEAHLVPAAGGEPVRVIRKMTDG